MIASFIWTTIKAITDDVTSVTATLRSVNQATWTLFRAHEGDAFRTTVGAEQAPFMLSIARTIRVRPPVLCTASQLDVSDRADATALAFNFAIHASTEN